MRWLLMLAITPCLTAQAGMECVKEMMVPGYTYVARRAAKGGDVRAKVTVVPSGKPSKIQTDASDSNLAEKVRDYLASETAFDPSCKGKTVEIMFTFRQEGEAVSEPHIFVKFRPPNHFVIISRPQKPIIN